MDKSFVVKAFTKWADAKNNITETPSLKGQTFEGWSLSNRGELIDDEYQFITDTNIYPLWQTSYIRVNLQLGEGVSDVSFIRVQRDTTFGENINAFNIQIDYLGYKLKHWSLQQNGDPINNDYIFSSNTTIYAVYEIDYITIYLNSIAEMPYPSLLVQRGIFYRDIKNDIIQTIEGYVFNGWSVNPDGEPLLNDDYQFLEDCNIYASFSLDTSVTVRFYNNYDDNYIDIKAQIGDTLKDVLNTFDKPQRENWVLYGWSSTQNYNNLVDNDLFIIDDNVSLYAIWVFNITINLQNDYPQLIDAQGIFGTFICCDGETVQDLMTSIIDSDNYQKLNNLGSFNFINNIYENNIALESSYKLQPQNNNLNIKIISNKTTYIINPIYQGENSAEDAIRFEFDTITTVNDLFNEFKKYSTNDYDLYGEVIGFDYANSRNPDIYDDGLYLNFNTLNNVNIDFLACNLNVLTLAIKQTSPILLNRGWREPTSIQINGVMTPFTAYVNNDLRTKIGNLCANDKAQSGLWLQYTNENGYLLQSSSIFTDQGEQYYNYISILPNESQNYYITETYLYGDTVNINNWRNLQFIVDFTGEDNTTKTIELVYLKQNTDKYISIGLNLTINQGGITGINVFNTNGTEIYIHDNQINGIEKAAALIIHNNDTFEVEKIIQLNNVKLGDVFGINTKDVTYNNVIGVNNYEMPIISEVSL